MSLAGAGRLLRAGPQALALNAGHPSAQGLLHYWPMPHGGGRMVPDLGRHGNPLLTQGGAGFVPGPHGGALSVLGADADAATTQRSEPGYSIAEATFFFVAAFDTLSNFGGVILHRGGSGVHGVHITSGGTALTTNWNDVTWSWGGGTNVPSGDDVYHRYATTITTAGQSAYLDGNKDSQSVSLSAATFSSPLWVGRDPQGGRTVAARFAAIGMWDRRLSDAEIATLFDDPFALVYTPQRFWLGGLDAGTAPQDTPELYGRPFGQHGQSQMHQVLAQ